LSEILNKNSFFTTSYINKVFEHPFFTNLNTKSIFWFLDAGLMSNEIVYKLLNFKNLKNEVNYFVDGN
jgi:hypothetical protein